MTSGSPAIRKSASKNLVEQHQRRNSKGGNPVNAMHFCMSLGLLFFRIAAASFEVERTLAFLLAMSLKSFGNKRFFGGFRGCIFPKAS